MANTEIGFSLKLDGTDSIDKLTNGLKETKLAMKDLDRSTEEYANKSKRLGEIEAELKGVKKQQDDINKSLLETSNALRPYDQLSAKLNRLRKDYKDLAVAGKENSKGADDLRKEIIALDTQLKGVDASVGQFQRNVGNYSSATQGFGAKLGAFGDKASETAEKLGGIGGPAGLAIKAFQGIGVAVRFALGPIGIAIGVIALIVESIKAFFTSSEEGQDALARFGAVFKTVFGAIQDVLAVVGGAIIKGVELIGQGINNVVNLLGGTNNKLEKAIQIANQIDELENRQRKNIVGNAKLEQQIAEARNKAAQKDKFTNEERLKFLDDAITAEKELLKNNQDIAERKLNIVKAENKQRRKLTEEQKTAEAQAEADLINIKTQNFSKERELLAQRVEAINAIKSEEKAAEAERQKAYEEAKKRQEELTAARKKFQEDEKQFLEASARLNKSITEKTNAILTDFIADEFAKRRKVAEDAYNKEIEDLRNTVEESKKANQQRLDEAKKLYKENSKEFKKVQSDIDQEGKSATESLKQFETEREKKKSADIIQINKDEEAKKLEIKRTASKQAFDFAIKQDAETAKMLIEQKQIQFNTERALLDKNKKEDAEKILELERQLQQDIYFITANRIKDEQELIQNELKNNATLTLQEQTDLNNRLSTLKNEEVALFADAEQKKRDEIDETNKKLQKSTDDYYSELNKKIQQAGAFTKLALDTINGFIEASEQKRLDRIEKDEEANQRALENLNERLQRATGLERRFLEQRIASEEETAKKLAKEKEKLEKDAAKRKKASAIIESVINTALAVSSALATPPAPNVVAALIAGIAGAAQTAVIAAQPLAKGGVVGKGDEIVQFASGGRVTSKGNIKPLSNGDNVLATLKTGEIVLNESQQRRIGYASLKKAQIPNFANGGLVGAPSTLITNANNSIANEQMRVNLMDEMISATNSRIDRLSVVYTATTDFEVEKGRNDKKTIKANSTF
jgi:hypothetical protein